MSNDLTYRAVVHLKPGSNQDDFEAAFVAAMAINDTEVSLSEVDTLDPRIPEVISFEIETYGTGGHIDDRQASVVKFLDGISALGGLMQVCDQDMSPSSDEAIINHGFGPTQRHKDLARVLYAFETFKDSVNSVVSKEQLDAVKAAACANFAAELEVVQDYHALVQPKPTPVM